MSYNSNLSTNLCIICDVESNILTVRNLTESDVWLGTDSLDADGSTDYAFQNQSRSQSIKQMPHNSQQ